MDANTYLIIHLIGLATVAIGLGGMLAGDQNRKMFAMAQGIGLLIILVSGFGMLAKMQLGFPHFAMVKLILWLLLGGLPVVFRKSKTPVFVSIVVLVALIGVAAWLGVTKPPLW
jgi:hypothetical protein